MFKLIYELSSEYVIITMEDVKNIAKYLENHFNYVGIDEAKSEISFAAAKHELNVKN